MRYGVSVIWPATHDTVELNRIVQSFVQEQLAAAVVQMNLALRKQGAPEIQALLISGSAEGPEDENKEIPGSMKDGE